MSSSWKRRERRARQRARKLAEALAGYAPPERIGNVVRCHGGVWNLPAVDHIGARTLIENHGNGHLTVVVSDSEVIRLGPDQIASFVYTGSGWH